MNQFIYLQHRYYGKSIPFGSREEALKNASTLGYFNSAQAITDYAEILLYIKEKFNARHSPVIVIGGSYAGSKLASHASSCDSRDERYEMNVINVFRLISFF